MITWDFVPLGLILPDQPNRAVRTRMLRGVGGGSCEAPPYPDGHNFIRRFFVYRQTLTHRTFPKLNRQSYFHQ
jgi:hypothetical protein